MATDRRALAVVAGTGIALTVIAGAAVHRIQSDYFANNSYFFDSVYYSFENARLYERVALDGRLAVASAEWTGNPRHPLRTVPLVLFAPSLLARPMGHLATALPTLAVFLFLLGWFVRARTHSLAYAVATMALFVALPGLYDPVRGLGPYLLDLPAALLIGGGVLCLLSSRTAGDVRWLVAFGALVALAALSRFTSALYAAAIGGPILTAFLLRRWMAERRVVALLRPVTAVAVVLAVMAGPYLVTHLPTNVSFYRTFGYALGAGVTPAVRAAADSLLTFFSTSGLLGLGLLAALQIARRGPRGTATGVLLLAWMAAAVLVVQILVLRSGAHAQATLYAAPGMFVLAVVPVRWPARKRRPLARLMTPLAAVAAVVVACAEIPRHVRAAQHRSPDKTLDVTLARRLAEGGGREVWDAFFDEYAWIPSLEAFYRYGVLPIPAGQDTFFTVHESTWQGSHPGLSPADVAALVYERTCRWVDVAVAFDDPGAADARLDGAYTREVARSMSVWLARDGRWERTFTMRGTRYGNLAGYRNRGITPPNPAYTRRLRGEPLY